MAAGMGERPLNGIVVGLGVMGSYHLRILNFVPDVEVVALVDPSSERRREAERLYPRVPAYAALADALGDVDADFVCLAAPVAELARLATESAAAGLAMLVEKPLAATEEEALRVVQLAESRGVPLSVGHVERFNPAVAALKAKLDEGTIGELYQIHARRLSPFPDRNASRSVALDLATHELDIMRYLTGDEIGRVFAEVASRTAMQTEDLICASLRLDGGATGVLEANWLTPAKVRELSVTGERGMFVVNYLTQDLTFYENPRAATEWSPLSIVRGPGEGNVVRYALERREPLQVQWDAFLQALRTGGEMPVSGWDGFAALSAACAIQRSGVSHRPVVPKYRRAERRQAAGPLRRQTL